MLKVVLLLGDFVQINRGCEHTVAISIKSLAYKAEIEHLCKFILAKKSSLKRLCCSRLVSIPEVRVRVGCFTGDVAGELRPEIEINH